MFNTNTIISSHAAIGVLHQQQRFIIIGLLLVTIACQPSLHQQASSKEKSPEQITPELAFISFKITKDSAGKTNVSVISITKAEGRVVDESYQMKAHNVVRITLLNKEKEDMGFTTIEHPLLKDVEVITESGTFERKSVSLKEAEFFVRMNLKPQTSYIRIDEMINGVQKEIAVLPYQTK